MSWRAVAVVWVVLIGLVAFVLLVEREPEVAPPVPETAPERSLLGIEARDVHAIELRRRDARVRAVRDGDRWRTVEPAGAAVPSDLVAAVVATLTAGQVSEVVAEAPRPDELAAFGLDAPRSTIVLTVGPQDAPHGLTVLLGERNPTRTALYGRRTDDPRVFLVGLNVRYYEDLIFDAAGDTVR